MKHITFKSLLLISFTVILAFNSCEDDPIDAAIKNALDFEGVFVTDGGSEVTLQPNGSIIFTKEGSDWPTLFTYLTPPIELAFGFDKVLGNNTWGDGYARLDGGFGAFYPSTITLSESSILIKPDNSLQSYVFARKNSSGGGGTGTIDTLIKVPISGNTLSRKTYSFTLPSGIKSMTIKTLPVNASNLNFADLFVRYNSMPVVNHNPPTNYNYTWEADCASTLSNNAVESCTFSAPQSGTWNVLLYGYNNNFECYLAIIVER